MSDIPTIKPTMNGPYLVSNCRTAEEPAGWQALRLGRHR